MSSRRSRRAACAVLLLLPPLALACGTTRSHQPTGPTSWEQVMEDVIGPSYEDVLVVEAGKDPEAMDFELVEETATRAARAIALGHGPLERKDVPGFADLARETEQWFETIAARARARRGAEVQRLIVEGERRYCDRCHDAADH